MALRFDPSIQQYVDDGNTAAAVGAGVRLAGARLKAGIYDPLADTMANQRNAIVQFRKGLGLADVDAGTPSVPSTLPKLSAPGTIATPSAPPVAPSTLVAVNGSTANPDGNNFAVPQIPTGPAPSAPITRFDPDATNGLRSPLFTNLPLSNFQTARSTPLPSVGGFLSGVKSTSDFSPPTAAAAGGGVSADNFDRAALLQRANANIEAGEHNIVKGWIGRQQRRQYDNLAQDDATTQNAITAARAVGVQERRQATDVPIANLQAQIAARGQNFGLAPHLPRLRIENAAANAVDAGDYDSANTIGTTFVRQPYVRPTLEFATQFDPTGTNFITTNKLTGATTVQSLADLQAEQKAERARQALARAERARSGQ